MKNKLALSCTALAATLCLPSSLAETLAVPATPATLDGAAAATRVEAYASGQRLSAGFPDWREVGVRGVHEVGPHVLRAELATMRRWDESGLFGAVGDTYTFNPDWYGSLSVGAGDGASYLPRVRVDSFLNRKLLPARNLIGTLGLAYYDAPDGHIDRSMGLGAIYYFEQPWVVQGEMRFTRSNPGQVDTRQYFVAATWGRGKTQVTARHGWGMEGYQSIGAAGTLVNFRSRETRVGVRHWIGPRWGVAAGLESYHNPTYDRSGATLGIFWQLP